MKIILSPFVSSLETPKISLIGLELRVGDTIIDLSLIPEGGQGEATEDSPLIGIVTREEVTIKYPYNTDVYASNQSTNQDDYIFEITDGEIECPLIKKKEDKEILDV